MKPLDPVFEAYFAAYAEEVLNSCLFCKHCQYIADHRMHYCMLHKKDILPEQEQCKDHERHT